MKATAHPTPLVHIILDGFDACYLRSAPFLAKHIGQGGARPMVIPSPFGVRGMIFSGTLPAQNKDFTDLWRDSDTSRLRFLHFLFKSSQPLSHHNRWLIKLIVRLLSGEPCRIPKHLPTRYLPLFDSPRVARRFSSFKDKGSPPTLIDHLRDNRIPFQYFGPPFTSFWSKPLSQLAQAIKPKSKYVLAHVVTPDIYGHQFGPKADKTEALIQEIDSQIQLLCKNIRSQFPHAALIIHSDHGMSQVKNSIDFESKIKQWPLTAGIDFDYFLDSTMARFWLLNRDKHEMLIEWIQKDLVESKLLDDHSLKKYGMAGLDPRFGDFFAIVPEGTIISPNFYQAKPVNGMHGYGVESSRGILAWSGISPHETIQKEISLVDIYPTVTSLLGITPHPNTVGNPIF